MTTRASISPAPRNVGQPLPSRASRTSGPIAAAFTACLVVLGSPPVSAEGITRLPPSIDQLVLPAGAYVAPSLRAASGSVDVVIQLTGPSLAQAMGPNAKRVGGRLDRAGQRAHLAAAKASQNAVSRMVAGLGGKELGRVSKALNAVIATVDATAIEAIAASPGVASVRPLRNYEMHLAETVPYIGARSGAFARPDGADGSGITVAVLDSGIDYTHAAFGGEGTLAAYAAAYGAGPGDPAQTTRDGLFPTAKVVEGYDFVGEAWPNGPLAPDPDPIDFQGHGSHVADIVAGANGVASGASLVAVKVCSAVASSCNGLALLQGMDFALDPNGDGDISDAVDIINMSLGSGYGQEEDDLSFAAQAAVDLGVTVVASAGNSADRPYITGSPASTPGVISVAQTQVPGAVAIGLATLSPAAIAGQDNNTATLDFAPVTTGFEGSVVYAGLACSPIAPVPPGTVVLTLRGNCAVSIKVDNAADAGAAGFLMMLSAPGDAQTFSFGGPDTFDPVQSLIITQARGLAIRAQLDAGNTVTVRVDPAAGLALAGSMVASSSRGPSNSLDAIKPDIGAPGASISAIAGSGTGTEAFGGTSGAAPMVAGAAALLLSTDPSMDPLTVKGRLVGTGETNIYTNPATQPGVLAPISRIGGGEVRADKAAAVSTIAFERRSGQPNLSFGFLAVSEPVTVQRALTIRNLGSVARTYTLTPTFRYADDQASGAVTPSLGRNSISIAAGGEATVQLRLAIDPSRLPTWPFTFNASTHGSGGLLNGPEFDGYVVVSGGGDEIQVPWHVLPRASAAVSAGRVANLASRGSSVQVANQGAIAGDWSAFALTGTSGRIPPGKLPGPGDNLAAIDLKAVGVRGFPEFGVIQFAINTWDERSHPAYPAGFEIQIDRDRDGTPDVFVYNVELTGFAATGQTVVVVQQADAPSGTAFYFADADLNSSNRVFMAPLSALGLTASSQFDFTVLAYDNYFSGFVTDVIGPMRYTVGSPRYVFGGDLGDGLIPAGVSGAVPVTAVPGGAAASPSQQGILLMHYANPQGAEASAIEVRP
jgi:minor extracellular serine protease Vpr